MSPFRQVGNVAIALALLASLALAPDLWSQESDFLAFDRYDEAPRLLNHADLHALEDSLYTDALKDRGIGGTAVLSLYVDRSGTVRVACVSRSSGFGRLDDIALALAARMRFAPARTGGRPTPAWISRAARFDFLRLAPPTEPPARDRDIPLPPCPSK